MFSTVLTFPQVSATTQWKELLFWEWTITDVSTQDTWKCQKLRVTLRASVLLTDDQRGAGGKQGADYVVNTPGGSEQLTWMPETFVLSFICPSADNVLLEIFALFSQYWLETQCL